jgi:hypothetical protein
MSNLTHGLSKKIGPLKAWQWGLIAGGGIVVFTVLKKNGLSLTGKTAAETEESAAGLYDAGTSTTGTGTSAGGGGDNGTAPTPIQITIAPAETPTTPSTDTSELEAQLAASQAETAQVKEQSAAQLAAQKKREQARVEGWKNWGKKWKTQAAKNAGRKVKTTPQKKSQTTTKKALPATPKRVGGGRGTTTPFLHPRKPATSAKRNQAGSRTIAARTAQKKVLKPRTTTPAKRKK